MATRYHVEDVGRILLDVEEELKRLRAQFASQAGKTNVDVDDIFKKAENDLRAKAKVVLESVLQDDVKALPTIPTSKNLARAKTAPSSERPTRYIQSRGSVSRVRNEAKQEKDQLANADAARKLLQKRFGMTFEPAPEVKHDAINRRLDRGRARRAQSASRLYRHKTSNNASVLPEINRIDPSAEPPRVTHEDVSKGMYNMVQRGLIPTGTDLGPAFANGPAPLSASTMSMHDQSQYRNQPIIQSSSFNNNTLKLDLVNSTGMRKQPYSAYKGKKVVTNKDEVNSLRSKTLTLGSKEPKAKAKAKAKARREKKKEDMEESKQDFAETVEKIRDYNELLDEFSLHRFVIRKGKTLDNTPEFESYKRKNAVVWGATVTVIKRLEALMQEFDIPLAYMDGGRVVELAKDELTVPTHEQLLNCITNMDQVMPLMKIRGRRFTTGKKGRKAAATLIQSLMRMYLTRKKFQQYTGSHDSARLIQQMWICVKTRLHFLVSLSATKNERDAKWKQKQAAFEADWPNIKKKRRVVVHIPSLSVNASQRVTVENLYKQQNRAITRLCEIKDPNVDVVYVAPFQMTDDLVLYYERLMEVGGVSNPKARLFFVVPENMHRFPKHFSLSLLLLYSPRALRRIRNIVKGRASYLVPGKIGGDALRLAKALNIPMFGPKPSIANLYTTKSGCKGVFSQAKVMMPYGAHDIYDEHELLLTLAKLIAAFPTIEQWIFKINDEFNARGHAFFEARRLMCRSGILKQYQKLTFDPNYWRRAEVQQDLQETILGELESALQKWTVLVRPDCYPDYNAFLAAFCARGGVIEAVPLNLKGNPCANLLIEPNGIVTVVSTHEKTFSAQFRNSGGIFPQRCVPGPAIYGASKALGNVLFQNGIFGYVQIDYVVWLDKQTRLPTLWAVDLNIELTRTASSFWLFDFLMNGRFDPVGGRYLVEKPSGETVSNPELALILSQKQTKKREWEERHYIFTDYILYPQMSSLHFASFFNLCRLEGVSYDTRMKSGTIFMLIDALAGGVFGLMCISTKATKAAKLMWDNMVFIKKQVGITSFNKVAEGPKSNFATILRSVRRILQKHE